MSNNTFCSLCGALVEPYNGPTPENLLWNSEVRAVRTRAYVHDPYITGVGWLNYVKELIAPSEEYLRYDNPLWTVPEIHRIRYLSEQYWCYTVHDVCWELLRARVDPDHVIESNTLAWHLFALLYSTPTDGNGVLAPGHDYGGALAFQDADDVWGLTARIYNSDLFYLAHDPRDEFDFNLGSKEISLPDLSTMRISDPGDRDMTDIFGVLPHEIIVIILAALPSSDVCNLRMASRSVAAQSHPLSLDQAFWASRFQDGHEMRFVFAHRAKELPPEPVDWRQLYNKARAMLKDVRTYPGFQNRRRIWQVLSYLTPALHLRIMNTGHFARSPYGGRNTVPPDGYTSRGIVAGELVLEHSYDVSRGACATTELHNGCRLFENQWLSLTQATDSESITLGVSCISFNGRKYVCGIRWLSADDDPRRRIEIARAGYINPLSEEYMRTHSRDVLKALTVSVGMDGVVGLRFELYGSDDTRCYSFGNFDASGSRHGTARLASESELRHIRLTLGMDACKLTSVELLEDTTPGPERGDILSTRVQEGEYVEAWDPTIPTAPPEWPFPQADPSQFFNLCLNMDFGGLDGQLIRSLVRLDVLMGGYPRVFHGTRFVYADRSERFYGQEAYRDDRAKRLECIVQSFPIAGPQGEFINRVQASHCTPWDVIQAVTISTNHGRSFTFHLIGTNTDHSREYSTTDFIAPPGEAMTTFYASLKSDGGYFRHFVAQHRKWTSGPSKGSVHIPKPVTEQIHLTPDMLTSAQEMLAHLSGFAPTTATLSGVRKIRISTGKAGRGGGERHVSGLWLEYENDSLPVILGQWVAESASLVLDSDERLTEVTTWNDFTSRHVRVKMGQMVGLRLVTSRGQVKEVLQQRPEGMVCLKFRENPYAELMDMVWIYDYKWDHFRVMLSPKPANQDTQLIYTPNMHIHTYNVPQAIFLQNYNGSDALSAIEVSFKYLASEPSGLTFIYQSGETQTLGVRSPERQVESLQDGEMLREFEIGVCSSNRIGYLKFKTDKDRTLILAYDPAKVSEMRVLKHDIFPLDRRNPGPVENPRRTNSGVLTPVKKGQSDVGGDTESDVSASRNGGKKKTSRINAAPKTKYEKLPEGAVRLAGFWALPRRNDGTLCYPRLGPIFEG